MGSPIRNTYRRIKPLHGLRRETPQTVNRCSLSFKASEAARWSAISRAAGSAPMATLLRQADALLNLTPRMAACFEDHRCQERLEHPVQRLVSQRLFGILQGYEDVNDHDSGRQRAGASRRVHRPDRGGAGSGARPRHSAGRFEHLEPGWAFPTRLRRTGTRRSRPFQERWTISSLSLDACPSPPKEIWLDVDSTDDLVHGNQEGRHFHGYYDSYCYLPLYIVWDDLILCSRLRPANVDPAAGTAEESACGAHSQALAGDRDRRSRRRRLLPRRTHDVVRGQRGRLPVRPVRNPRLAERIARQLRKSRRRCLSTGESSRRFCDFRYRTRRSWSRTRRVVAKAEWLPGPRGLNARFVVTSLDCKRAGAQALYEDLYCARGEMENRGTAARPVRRPDLDRDRRTSCASTLRRSPATWWRRFGGSAWPALERTGRRPERFGRSSSRSPSASPFGGFCSHFRRSGRGRICSPGSWRTCRRLRRRPRPDAARDSPFLKAGTPATGRVCSGAGFHGVGIARSRASSCFVHEKALLADCALLPRPASRPENRARNPNPAP